MQQLPQTTIEIFNIEAKTVAEEKLPPKGYVIHTAYEPDPASSRINGEQKYGEFIDGQSAKNDRAVMIVCAPIGKAVGDNFRHYATTRSNMEQAGLGNYAEIRRSANAVHEASRRNAQAEKLKNDHFGL